MGWIEYARQGSRVHQRLDPATANHLQFGQQGFGLSPEKKGHSAMPVLLNS